MKGNRFEDQSTVLERHRCGVQMGMIGSMVWRIFFTTTTTSGTTTTIVFQGILSIFYFFKKPVKRLGKVEAGLDLAVGDIYC